MVLVWVLVAGARCCGELDEGAAWLSSAAPGSGDVAGGMVAVVGGVGVGLMLTRSRLGPLD